MFETTIQFKRASSGGRNYADKLVEELDRAVKVPGLSNIWVPPIRNRIDMLATGIKSPGRCKGGGYQSSRTRSHHGGIERVLKQVPGSRPRLPSAFRRSLHDVKIDRDAAARYGLNIADVQKVVAAAIVRQYRRDGRGLQRFPINVRYPRELRILSRRSVVCRCSPSVAHRSGSVTWPAIVISDGPPMLKSENAAVGLGVR